MKYSAIKLNPDSKRLLEDLFFELIPERVAHHKMDHVTLEKNCIAHPDLGKNVILYISHWGIYQEQRGSVIAVRVTLPAGIHCENKYPHITIATYGKTRSAMANKIHLWYPVTITLSDTPLVGTIQILESSDHVH